MNRRNPYLFFGAVFSLAVFIGAFILIQDRRERVDLLRETADQVFLDAAVIRTELARTNVVDPNLSLLAPTTLASADLITAIRREAETLNLVVNEAEPIVETISANDALVALNIDPKSVTEFFTVITAVVDVTGDVQRLIQLLDKTRDARVTGPLIGVKSVKFAFAGNQTVATLELVGIRFDGQQIAVASETNLP